MECIVLWKRNGIVGSLANPFGCYIPYDSANSASSTFGNQKECSCFDFSAPQILFDWCVSTQIIKLVWKLAYRKWSYCKKFRHYEMFRSWWTAPVPNLTWHIHCKINCIRVKVISRAKVKEKKHFIFILKLYLLRWRCNEWNLLTANFMFPSTHASIKVLARVCVCVFLFLNK